MKAEIFWHNRKYPGRLALLARPRGGDWLESEVESWASDGIDVVVSMLETSEEKEFKLEREEELSRANKLKFISFPVPDRAVPESGKEFANLVKKLRNALLAGKNVGIHCRQSVGRAPLLAAAVMTLFDTDPDQAFRQLGKARGREVPETVEQADWVRRFAEERTLAPA